MLVLLVSLALLLCGPATARAAAQDPPDAQDPPTSAGGDPPAAEVATSEGRAQDPQRPELDRVTLHNGDVLRGVLQDFNSGAITFHVEALGDLEIDLDDIADLSTAEPIVVVTVQRTHVEGRIRSLVDGQIQLSLEDGSFASIPVREWDAMRFPGGRAARWSGTLSVGGRVSDGNTKERRINVSLDFRRRSDADRVIGSFFYFYDEDFNDLTSQYELDERRGRGALQYDYFLGPQAYAWAAGSGSFDSEAEVDQRLILGVGGGYQFEESDSFHFEGLLGLAGYRKDYSTPEPTLEYVALRIAYNVEWEFLRGARFVQSVQALPSLENFNEDFYLRGDTRLRFTFWKGLFTELQWILDYDTAPAAGRDEFDSFVTLNLGWAF